MQIEIDDKANDQIAAQTMAGSREHYSRRRTSVCFNRRSRSCLLREQHVHVYTIIESQDLIPHLKFQPAPRPLQFFVQPLNNSPAPD